MSDRKGKTTNKAFRLEEFEGFGVRSSWTCLRCLNAIAQGNLEVYLNKLGCWFVEVAPNKATLLSWREFVFQGPDGNFLQTMRCEYCHYLGQDCFAPPPGFDDDWKVLHGLLDEVARDADPTNPRLGPRPEDWNTGLAGPARRRADAIKHAQRLYAAVDAVAKPFAHNCTAHNGSLVADTDPRSGVKLKARDRSATAVAQKIASKKRALQKAEADSDEEEVDRTPKKKKARFGMVDALEDANKDQEEINTQIASDRAARVTAHQVIVERYNSMTSKQKGAYTKSTGRGKPVPGGWEKKGKFTPLE